MIRFSSGLLALAANFTGKYAPFQGIQIAPLAGGVSVVASNRGAVAFFGYDPKGQANREVVLLPDGELIKAARGIKTAEREVTIDGGAALVTTYYKDHSTSKEFPAHFSSVAFPPMRAVVDQAIAYWGETPELTTTAGRYDLALLDKAVRAMADDAGSIVLSGYQGGPLRLQREDLQAVVLLMPQAAKPLPTVPPWLASYAAADLLRPAASHETLAAA